MVNRSQYCKTNEANAYGVNETKRQQTIFYVVNVDCYTMYWHW